ncbi:MAG TPA: DinB family protein [Acidobacteriaceae bacterium]
MTKLAELLLLEFDSEMASTRRVLQAVPEEKFDWRPHAKSFPMRELAGHVAELSSWPSEILRRERWDVTKENRPENTSYKPADAQQMLKRFEEWAARARADLAAATDDAMQQEWVMTWDGYEIIRLPRYHAIRKWSLNHLVHHRAQLGVYLRLNDVKVPGVYGPSADEQ